VNSVQEKNLLPVTWYLNRLDSIGGYSAAIIGDPQIVKDDKAILFDGINDGLIVHGNPLDKVNSFSIEIILKPLSSSSPENKEQRFFHIQSHANEDCRILVELRLVGDNKWFLDTFIKSGSSDCTLYSENFVHDVNKWHHIALIYENGVMQDFVNGKKELEGKVDFIPIEDGNVSIGTRMNKRSWYKGLISKIKFTPNAIEPEKFMKIPGNN
jgi:Concanavalin A-like lectin/glucanases superfamily